MKEKKTLSGACRRSNAVYPSLGDTNRDEDVMNGR